MPRVTPDPAALDSPCTGVCALDPVGDWCLDCGRTVDEIAGWSTMQPQERSIVRALLPARLTDLRSGG